MRLADPHAPRSGLPLRALLVRRGGGVVMTLLCSALAVASALALMGVSGWFITGAALTTAAAGFNLLGPSALVRLFSFTRILSRYGEKLVGHDVTLKLLADIRDWTMRGLIPLAPLAPAAWRHGDLVSRLVADVDTLDAAFIAGLGPVLSVLAMGAALWGVMAALLPGGASAFALGFGTATLLTPLLVIAATRRNGGALVEGRASLRVAVLDGIEGHGDLVAFGRTDAATAAVAGIAAMLGRARQRQSAAAATGTAVVAVVAGLTTLAVLRIGLAAAARGEIGTPVLIGLVFAVLASFEGAATLIRAAVSLGAARSAKARIEALVAGPGARSAERTLDLPEGSDVSLDRVRFAYRPERTLLDGVSLECPAGSRTAIVGESGCGKSTLLALLLGLVDPASGTVRVAGRDIATVAPDRLHRRVTLMSQSTPVFLGTIRDNLLLGRPEATDEDLWRALAQARLDGVVARLPGGLGTWCDEDGRTLSAGQARRLCLARALLTPAPILLLDEPTSGLDNEAEQAFLADLATATAGRTVLIATHAALPGGAVGRVVTLADGRIDG